MFVPLLALFAAGADPAPRPGSVKAFAVTPAAEPRPALQFELLPPLRDRTVGNAALAYLRASLHAPARPSDAAAALAHDDKLAAWRTGPIDQLPRDDVRMQLDAVANLLRDVDRAARSTECDWDIDRRLRADGVAALLPDVQKNRELIGWVQLRARLELAEGRYDDAARTLQTGFQLAAHAADSPTLISYLVGIALESITLECVEDWVSRPGSPNLYWALTALPAPLIDARRALQGEELFLEALMPSLAKLRRKGLSAEEAQAAAEQALIDLQNTGRSLEPLGGRTEGGALNKAALAAYTVWAYPSAKKELIERGRPAAEVDAMPGGQVVILASLERFLELRDGQWKWAGLPYHEARAGLRRAAEATKTAQARNSSDAIFGVLVLTLPASEKVLLAGARTERKVAILRTLEAIRLHAAANGDRPPATLAAVTLVPVPRDPMTGEPFAYAADGPKVTLATPPSEDDGRGAPPLRYELTFGKP